MNTVVLLSGGSGARMQAKLPKQHIVMEGKQIIEYTLTAFAESDCVDSIVVVSNPKYVEDIIGIQNRFPKLKAIIEGGETRIQSVANAVRYLQNFCMPLDKVIVSDAVRPCITLNEIKNIFSGLDTYKAVTTGVEIYETVLRVENDSLVEIIPRDGIIRQTSPEGYLFSTLSELYLEEMPENISRYKNIGIDQLYSKGVQIGLVKSNPLNFKITTPEDLLLFNSVLKQGFQRIISWE